MLWIGAAVRGRPHENQCDAGRHQEWQAWEAKRMYGGARSKAGAWNLLCQCRLQGSEDYGRWPVHEALFSQKSREENSVLGRIPFRISVQLRTCTRGFPDRLSDHVTDCERPTCPFFDLHFASSRLKDPNTPLLPRIHCASCRSHFAAGGRPGAM